LACCPTVKRHDFPRAPWLSILLRQGYGGQGRSTLPLRHPRQRPGWLAAQPSNGMISHGHLGRAASFAKATEDKDARPSPCVIHGSGEWSRHPIGNGTISRGHLGRASSFAKATEDKDARSSTASHMLACLFTGHGGTERAAPSRPFPPSAAATKNVSFSLHLTEHNY
jgi:hypothetical protein